MLFLSSAYKLIAMERADDSANKRHAFLRCGFDRGLRFRRQLQHCCLLSLTQDRQQHDLAVRKFECVVMRRDFSFVDLPKDRRLMVDNPIAPRKQAVRQVADLAGK